MRHPELILNSLLLCAFSGTMIESARGDAVAKPAALQHFIEASCLDCHDSGTAEGGLDLESLSIDLTRREFFDRWVLIHDRVRDGEMPPPDEGVAVRVVPIGWSSRANGSSNRRDDSLSHRQRMLRELAALLIKTDRQRIASAGRAKVRRLNRFEYENTVRELIGDLKGTTEADATLLDQTMVLYGSNFGDANKHTTDNMPILLAGGGFRHGQHLAFDREANYPLPNLFVSMLQQMGIETDKFATSTGTMRGLEFDVS